MTTIGIDIIPLFTEKKIEAGKIFCDLYLGQSVSKGYFLII